MKRVRFEKRSQYNGRLIEAGEEAWVEDGTVLAPHMIDVGQEVRELRPAQAQSVAQAAAREMLERHERDQVARRAAAEAAARASRDAHARVLLKAEAAAQEVLDAYKRDSVERAAALAEEGREAARIQTQVAGKAQDEAAAAVAAIFAKYDAEVAAVLEQFAKRTSEAQQAEDALRVDADAKAHAAAQGVLEDYQRGTGTA